MSTEAHLALWLDAPLKSWGHNSYFQNRHTALWPTKSGIVGLLTAACGLDKLDGGHEAEVDQHVAALADLRTTVIWLPLLRGENSDRALPVHLREDFHTVGGGYISEADVLRRPRKAGDGKPRKDPDITVRQYLEDARFGVILSAPEDWTIGLLEGQTGGLELLAKKVQHPVWGVWFGRKCCLPSAPIFVALETSFDAAWKALLRRSERPQDTPFTQFDRLCELEPDEEPPRLASTESWTVHVDSWNDHPVRYGPGNHDRAFRPRRIVEFRAQRPSR